MLLKNNSFFDLTASRTREVFYIISLFISYIMHTHKVVVRDNKNLGDNSKVETGYSYSESDKDTHLPYWRKMGGNFAIRKGENPLQLELIFYSEGGEGTSIRKPSAEELFHVLGFLDQRHHIASILAVGTKFGLEYHKLILGLEDTNILQ